MQIKSLSYKEAARFNTIFLTKFKNESLEKDEFFAYLASGVKENILRFAKKEFSGEENEVKTLWLGSGSPEKIVLMGLGEKKKWHERKQPLLARKIVSYAKSQKIHEFATSFSDAYVFSVNALMANFEFNKYKERPREDCSEVKTVILAAKKEELAKIKNDIKDGTVVGEETNHARDLSNTPGGDMTPAVLAKEAKKAGAKAGFSVKILEERDLKKLGAGGILGVARGSSERPKMIIMEYRRGPKSQKPLALVGKGVTFDTGGLNLKPEEHIFDMHMDMSGGAAVIHGMAAIARLKLALNAVGIIPAVENMPSGSSYRPGDLLKSMSGKTIEVLNTDAEGRIILADALYYAAKNCNPGLLVDFATLTGAAHVALGNYISALFTNREILQEKLIAIGRKSGDYVWPLPLWDEYLEEIKGTFGDLANLGRKGSRYGGAIHGAKFLEQFVDNYPWAHIDIAPRMIAVEGEFLAKGAAGAGVRYIAELAREYPNLNNLIGRLDK